MTEIVHGIDIYYENKLNVVFFSDGTRKEYTIGGILFEIFSDEAFYMISEKVGNMIKCFPANHESLSVESITSGFKWLYGTIMDDDFPVATELFRSSFDEKISESLETMVDESEFACVGDFLDKCFKAYIEDMKTFALYVDSLAADASGIADDFGSVIAESFKESVVQWNDIYSKRCSRRRRNGNITLETHKITNFLQLLVFEYCRMKKEKKVLKQCLNCGRYFIPKTRRDAKYCFEVSPDNPNKTCAEIAPQKIRSEKRKNDPIEREHNRTYSRLAMQAKRAKEYGLDPKIYYNRIDEEVNHYHAEKAATNNILKENDNV